MPSFEPTELHALSHINNQGRLDIGVELQPIKHFKDPMLCDIEYLPFLAYARKADLWSDILHENEQRKLIAASRQLHRHKGTVWAILEVLKAIGLSSDEDEARIIEWRERNTTARYHVKRDGSFNYDASKLHNDMEYIYPFVFGEDWTEFLVVLKVPITQVKAALALKFIEMYKPARSKLLGFVFETLNARDGSINYDATYTHGVAI